MTTTDQTKELTNLDDAPGACDLCRAIQRGDVDGDDHDTRNHHACGLCPENLLRDELNGLASCSFDDGAWAWRAVEPAANLMAETVDDATREDDADREFDAQLAREDDIEAAAKYLNATRYAGGDTFGWLHTDELRACICDDDAMAKLGEAIRGLGDLAEREDAWGENAKLRVYLNWYRAGEFATATAQDVAVALPELRGVAFDANGLRASAGAAADYLTCAVIDHALDQIEALLRGEPERTGPDVDVYCIYARSNGRPAGFGGRYRTKSEAQNAAAAQRQAHVVKRERISFEDYATWESGGFRPRGWVKQ